MFLVCLNVYLRFPWIVDDFSTVYTVFCICIYIYISTYIYMYICIYVYMYIYSLCNQMCTCGLDSRWVQHDVHGILYMYLHKYICMYIYIYAYIFLVCCEPVVPLNSRWLQQGVHSVLYMYSYIYIYTYIYVYMYIYWLYVQMRLYGFTRQWMISARRAHYFVHVHIYIYLHTYIYLYVYAFLVCSSVYLWLPEIVDDFSTEYTVFCIYMYIYTSIYTNIYIYIYAYICFVCSNVYLRLPLKITDFSTVYTENVSHSPDLHFFCEFFHALTTLHRGVATMSRLLKTTGLFCQREILKRLYSAKETSNFKEPNNSSHPITKKSECEMSSKIRYLFCRI